MSVRKAIIINVKDNVANALVDIKKGDVVKLEIGKKYFRLPIKSNIPFGHKFTTKKISKGEKIIKYGEVIGKATNDIDAGEYVHIHNVIGSRARGDLENSKV